MDTGGVGGRPSLNEGLIGSYLKDLHRDLTQMSGGEIATYIPELAKANPDWLGLAIATTDGAVYAVGDVDTPFTIQSVSKPFMYALALETLGREQVLKHVGVEPTGDAFNATVFDEVNNRPFNPMVNAGAIAVSALVKGDDEQAKTKAMLDLFARFSGRPMAIDEAVFQSERETGERNRVIAALMAQAAMLTGDTDAILDLYFRQCSVIVTCRDLAMMAAVLANYGVHPVTGERALDGAYVHDVLTVMNSCGMYNYAGQWSYEVGVPAKSGVSGSIAAVIPGQVGIAAFSPPLDRFGNSVRAIAACKRIADDFGLHVFRTAPSGASVIRSESSGEIVRSKRTRTPSEREILAARGGDIRVIEAQGALFFGSAERLCRRVEALLGAAHYLVLDFRRVFSVDEAAGGLFVRLMETCDAAGVRVMIAQPPADLRARISDADRVFADKDAALEYCETRLIDGESRRADFDLADVVLFRGMSKGDLKAVSRIAREVSFERGACILKEGDPADLFLVIVGGAVSIRLALPGEGGARSIRVATASVGATIGEMALFDGGRRSADVIADEPTLCYSFSIGELNKLARRKPRVLHAILANLTRDLSERLRAANREIRALQQ